MTRFPFERGLVQMWLASDQAPIHRKENIHAVPYHACRKLPTAGMADRSPEARRSFAARAREGALAYPRSGSVRSTATSTLSRQTVWALLDQGAGLHPARAFFELQPPSPCGAGFLCESQCVLARLAVQPRPRVGLPLAVPLVDVCPVNCQSEQYGFSLELPPRCYIVITRRIGWQGQKVKE